TSVLFVTGAMGGASGLLLAQSVCKAMNPPMVNVRFGSLGPTSDTPSADETYKTVKSTSADEIAMLLDGVRRVVIVPGYGMAVAQAQHTVRQFASLLEERGAVVEYAIHPVARRVPGPRNVRDAWAHGPAERR